MSRRAVTIVDVLVCMILVSLCATLCLAVQNVADDVQSRVRCASNMRQIGQALLLYANENKGAYPRTQYAPGPSPTPTWGTPYEGGADPGPVDEANPFAKDDSPAAKTRPKPNDVTASMFLLLRTQDITSEVFVCPATMKEKWEFGGGANTSLNWSNWQGVKSLREHLSYSYQNPYPSNDAVAKGFKLNHAISAEFVVAGDMNPGNEALKTTSLKADARAVRAINSPNHSRDGQNFLFGDGHVEFNTTPFCGVKRDNVYTFGPSGIDHPDKAGDGIVGSPTSAEDSILLPTARDLGAADERGNLIETQQLTPLTDAQKADLRKKIVGNYVREEGGRRIRLQVTDEQLIASSGPVTVTLNYDATGSFGERVRLRLTAPETDAMAANLVVERDGSLTVTGSHFVAGTWRRQQ